ncbi:MAG: hydrogenase nickel incorporation protein HypB [Actinomycetota bacterium]|nr:hydrogenase nickel incorporation protein HypB [Actinomycetota bacterium]
MKNPGGEKRKVEVLEGVFDANEMIARENQELLQKNKACMVNIMASPGAGKTNLIMRTLESIGQRFSCAVVEGDIAGKVDAEKIAGDGFPAIQINTGGSCHLEAKQVKSALERLEMDKLDLIFVENVGNLVCPAEFSLGEDLKVMILSVAEGDDKPLKYPLMFRESDVLIINKMDLLGFTDFELEKVKPLVRGMNPSIRMFEISCREGTGVEEWAKYLEDVITKKGESGGA